MNRLQLLRKYLMACTLLFAISSLSILTTAEDARAQLNDAGEILRAGAQDANVLMENYLKPFGAGFGADLNSGWINTASAYKPFGFDLRVNAALSIVPDTDRMFSISDLGLQQVKVLEGSSLTPTVSGDEIDGAYVGQTFTNPVTGQEEELYGFNLPQGIGFPYVPAPMVQLTVGLAMDSDISVRYFPTYDVPDMASVGLWGFGFRHGLNQWLPGGKLLPVDLSVQVGYTQINANSSFNVQPEIDDMTHVPSGYERNAARWRGQGMDLKASGFTGNLLVGKNLSFLSLFAGLGVQSSKVEIFTPGSFPVLDVNPDFDPRQDGSKPRMVSSIDAPIDLKLNGANDMHALAGFRIRMAIFTISGSYTYANYPVANLGIGISFR